MNKTNYCVCCGKEIPEGVLLCWSCENSGPLPSVIEVKKGKNVRIQKSRKHQKKQQKFKGWEEDDNE